MPSLTLSASFYRETNGGNYQPTEATIGPWSPELQHGGPPSALLIHVLSNHPSPNNLVIARVTFEFFSAVPLGDCQIQVETLRPGKKVELLRGQYISGGKTCLLAHAWRIESLPGTSEPILDPFEIPAFPDPHEQKFFRGIEYFPYGEALEWRFAEGGYDQNGPATVWTRPKIPLVEGSETSSLESLVLMIDSANGVSAELDIREWTFVPVDMTLGLYRLPRGPWVGMSARTVMGAEGIGQTTANAFDKNGCCGSTIQSLFIRHK